MTIYLGDIKYEKFREEKQNGYDTNGYNRKRLLLTH